MISLLTGIDSTASALQAEQTRMDIVAQNIVNAESTHGPNGKPYQRQEVVFESVLRAQQANGDPNSGAQTVQIAHIVKDNRPPRMVYDPTNPSSDKHGMVAMPDISIPEEMVDMIAASRAYDANIAVVKNAHSIAMQALSIGKH
jgi:flagellar basal-body rod protein FlgC